ncbi:hypothetical protein MXD62_19970 [Frankia sp. Mgl5]|uniref:hypothetical protein n=1 Tax=Frankia sp. Mgl5 TaxID=2933793 RepID=UPI00200D9BC5|nr:hypothetical protein [Frankia sp. Mgl5]MCK9929429.1 hypothetical protein [Frankia sp. Mgl5]
MALGIRQIRDALISHLMVLGVFDTVSARAPDALPGTGVHGLVAFNRMVPARSSGLDATSMVPIFTVFVLVPLEQEPADDIDIVLLEATDPILASLIGDFTLGGLVRMVDVRGSEQSGGGTGAGLTVQTGHMTFPDQRYRFAEITVPLIVNDIYPEAP